MGYYSDLHAGRANPGSSARRKKREREKAEHQAQTERQARAAEAEEQHEPEAQGEPKEQHEAFWRRLEPGWWEPHFADGEEAVRTLAERNYWTPDEAHGYKVAVNRYHTQQRKERQEQ